MAGINVRSLRDKTSVNYTMLKVMAHDHTHDAIFINEHHRETPLEKEFAQEYDIFYGDMDQRKGGALIMTKKELKAMVPFPAINSRDSILIKIRLDGQHIFLHSFYINPDQYKFRAIKSYLDIVSFLDSRYH